MATHNEAVEAIFKKFLTDWASTTPVVLDEEAYAGPTRSSWVRLSVRHTDGQQDTLGASGTRKFARYGIVFVQVFTPANSGRRAGDLLAQQARAVFEGVPGSSFDVQTLRFYGGRILEQPTDGGWAQQNVEVPFEYDEIK